MANRVLSWFCCNICVFMLKSLVLMMLTNGTTWDLTTCSMLLTAITPIFFCLGWSSQRWQVRVWWLDRFNYILWCLVCPSSLFQICINMPYGFPHSFSSPWFCHLQWKCNINFHQRRWHSSPTYHVSFGIVWSTVDVLGVANSNKIIFYGELCYVLSWGGKSLLYTYLGLLTSKATQI